MKKILLLAAFLSTALFSQAGTGALTINNYTDHQVTITMYARFNTCALGCSALISSTITLNYYGSGSSSYSCTDFCDFLSTYSWVTSPACTSLPCPSYRSDFQWTMADISVNTACWPSVVTVGDAGISCGSAFSGYYGCSPVTGYVSWSPLAGPALTDVAINIYQ